MRTYSSGMYMRLGFAVAAHIDADVLLLDEVFAVGDEEFQRKCFAKIFEFKQRGGTIVFVSHDAASVERLCHRAILLRNGRVELDGSAQEAIARYHTPARRGARPRGERGRPARVRQRRGADHRRPACSGPTARSGSSSRPASRSRSSCASTSARPVPPPRVTLELRDEAGLLLAASPQDTAELGWREEPGERVLRFAVERSPLADGRFRLRCELGDPAGRHLYHWLDDAARFAVYAGDRATGSGSPRRDLGARTKLGGR